MISTAMTAHLAKSVLHVDASNTPYAVSAPLLYLIASHCPQLRSLNLSEAKYRNYPYLNEDGKGNIDCLLESVALKCRQLQRLDVSHTRGRVTDASLMVVAKWCGQRRELDVSETNVTDLPRWPPAVNSFSHSTSAAMTNASRISRWNSLP